jgi:hypothetical protein
MTGHFIQEQTLSGRGNRSDLRENTQQICDSCKSAGENRPMVGKKVYVGKNPIVASCRVLDV